MEVGKVFGAEKLGAAHAPCHAGETAEELAKRQASNTGAILKQLKWVGSSGWQLYEECPCV